MATIGKTVAGRLTASVLIVHIFVLPGVFFVLLFLDRQSNEDQFLNYVRSYSRLIADSLERIEVDGAEAHVGDVLDGVMLTGDGVFAEVRTENDVFRGSLFVDTVGALMEDDFAVGEHGDSRYFTSVPISMIFGHAVLRLGFDEGPLNEKNKQAMTRGAAILLAYLALILSLVALIGRRVTQPIRDLQELSRNVASGHFRDRLTVDSDLVEFVDLSNDLDLMRKRLTGANRQLKKEIKDREKAQFESATLEGQLRHKQRLETVGTLAGGIAHELNNILVPILLFSDTAIEDLPTGSPAREDIERVQKSAQRAKSIVNQVLMFSRQIEGTNLEVVDLRNAVSESLGLVEPALRPNTRLEHEILVDEALVNGDKGLLSQVIINLCNNANTSISDAGGVIAVKLEKVDLAASLPTRNGILPAGAYFVLSVTDTGEGIDHDSIERIFEPFYSTRPIGSGTGLGLSVVHGIANALKGGIVVSSTLGEGSMFQVYLPESSTDLKDGSDLVIEKELENDDDTVD